MSPSPTDYLKTDQDNAIARLIDFLKIPSISTDPDYQADCQRAADWLAQTMRQNGLTATVEPTNGHPIVVGQSLNAGADRPHVLFYGHYDVQPVEPLDAWDTPPFEPTIRSGQLFARGASDDKGQVMTMIEALGAYHQTAGELPINITLLIEGEEECGSENLEAHLQAHLDRYQADIAIVSDTAMWAPNEPAIPCGLRGLIYVEAKLFGPDRDLHSGVYGGTIANPANELIKILGQLFDADHRITIDHFYDDVAPLTDADQQSWADLGFDEHQWAQEVGLDQPYGEAGYTTLERRWARPSCDICGIESGYTGQGAKTIIPSHATAKINFRLAAHQDPDKIEQSLIAWLKQRTPPGCRWAFESFGQAHPVLLPTDSIYLTAASDAIQTTFGRRPRLVREGATIPVISTFKTLLHLDTLLIGFGLNDDNLHAPNEKFDLANFHLGTQTHAALIDELAQITLDRS